MQIAFADIRFLKESGHKTEALCFSFGRHLAQQAPGQPNPVRFLERERLFAERRSYSNVCVFNRPQSADRATFKCGRNLFPDNRRSHGVPPRPPPVNLGVVWKAIRDRRHTSSKVSPLPNVPGNPGKICSAPGGSIVSLCESFI